MARPLALLALIGAVAVSGCATAPVRGLAWRTGLWCGGNRAERQAAGANAASLQTLPIDPFGRPEQGWAIYAPSLQRDLRTPCPGFAGSLARWQSHRGLPPSGVLDAASLTPMKSDWQARRPFVALRAQGVCPIPPPDQALVSTSPAESLGDRPIRLRPGALKAYRRMVAAARREAPELEGDPNLLRIFSAWRDPDADAARCAQEGNCQGIVRAACSAHRTGLAIDLMLGAAPGFTADSSIDANRLFQSRTPAYRWLVRGAGRFGFVNYAFEPWHWEWTGEAP
ncbi:MAG: D-alanyl-D-alanine carboxypeptidase family protein [Caulobacteraceae bacterium]|nr:D-alanyl-D-alanine carboxypeptidase family protein [Caulobacteraceae bacterium]